MRVGPCPVRRLELPVPPIGRAQGRRTPIPAADGRRHRRARVPVGPKRSCRPHHRSPGPGRRDRWRSQPGAGGIPPRPRRPSRALARRPPVFLPGRVEPSLGLAQTVRRRRRAVRCSGGLPRNATPSTGRTRMTSAGSASSHAEDDCFLAGLAHGRDRQLDRGRRLARNRRRPGRGGSPRTARHAASNQSLARRCRIGTRSGCSSSRWARKTSANRWW